MRSLAIASLLLVVGCGSGIRPPDEYTGCATDEHWHRFDDIESSHQVVADDTLAPDLTFPTSGTLVSPSPSPFGADLPRFTWTPQPFDPGSPTGNVVYMNGPGCDQCCPEFNLGALKTAHLPAISGDVYDLQFFLGTAMTHRVLSTLQEWSPTAATWAELARRDHRSGHRAHVAHQQQPTRDGLHAGAAIQLHGSVDS